MTTLEGGGATRSMTTSFKPLLASLVLLCACDPPSTNVGEVTEPTDATGDASTDASPDTGTGDPGATSIEPSETTAMAESTGNVAETGDMEGGCLDTNYDCFDGLHEPLDCGGSPACDVLEVNDPSLNEFDPEPFAFVNPEAATCILDGLAAGAVGAYEIAVEPGQQNSIDYRLEVLTDGTLVIRSQEQQDKTCSGHENRFVLQPASYFEACAAEAEEALVLQCLVGAGDSAPCVDQGFECPA